MGILHAAYLLTCWSGSAKQVWSWQLATQEPSCFLSVKWHGEAFYELGVQGVRIFIFLSIFFLLSVPLMSQQNFLIYRAHTATSAL
jgi:hypothetical protein